MDEQPQPPGNRHGVSFIALVLPQFVSNPTRFFIPGGFAEDYEFTARALGIRHYAWWGDKFHTAPKIPEVAYPEGFQGNEIPIDGKKVAQLVEQRLLVDRD